jgi:hypothetical protein
MLDVGPPHVLAEAENISTGLVPVLPMFCAPLTKEICQAFIRQPRKEANSVKPSAAKAHGARDTNWSAILTAPGESHM